MSVELRADDHAALTPSPTPSLRLTLIGGFGLSSIDTGESINVPMSAQRLIAFLALRRQSQTRAFVAGNLWPDTSQQQSAANLRSTLWRLQDPGASSRIKTR